MLVRHPLQGIYGNVLTFSGTRSHSRSTTVLGKIVVTMDKRDSDAGHASKTAQRGLWRLMLKLPALRGRLQILAARSRQFDDLFEAYEEASHALERFQREVLPLLKEAGLR